MSELKHFKYIKKVKGKNGKSIYFYDMQSYKKWMSGDKTKTEPTKSETEKNTKTEPTKSEAEKKINEVKDAASKKIDKFKDVASQKTEEVKEAVSKNVDKAKPLATNYLNDKPGDTVSKGPTKAIKTTKIADLPDKVKTEVESKTKAEAETKTQEEVKTEETTKPAKEIKKSSSSEFSKVSTISGPTYDENGEEIPEYKLACPENNDSAEFSSSSYAAAMDLRKRGYDVECLPDSSEADMNEIASWYKDAKPVTFDDIDAKFGDQLDEEFGGTDLFDDAKELNQYTDRLAELVEKDMISQGNGASGVFVINGTQNDAKTHTSMNWEIVDGSVKISLGNVEVGMEEVTKSLFYSNSDDFSYVRTDNLEPSDKILKQVKNKKK